MWLKALHLISFNPAFMATVIKKGTSKSEVAKSIEKAVGKHSKEKMMKLAGALKADIDPLQYQKKLRDEWE